MNVYTKVRCQVDLQSVHKTHFSSEVVRSFGSNERVIIYSFSRLQIMEDQSLRIRAYFFLDVCTQKEKALEQLKQRKKFPLDMVNYSVYLLSFSVEHPRCHFDFPPLSRWSGDSS